MKYSIGFTLVIALLATACGKPEALHDESHEASGNAPAAGALHEMHDDHNVHIAVPVLPAGQRWPTDAPLREAMMRIRSAIEKVEVAYGDRQLTASDATVLASTVDENIRYMFANCKLAPEPDAALHALIVRMMNAASALKQEPLAENAVPQLLNVLHDYQNTFDHPGWTKVDAKSGH